MPSPGSANPADGQCGSCVHFRNDPASLKTVLAGVTGCDPACGSIPADNGLCVLHDRCLTARSWCARYEKADGAGNAIRSLKGR